jgi:two-component system chemotaxis response regulator CheV
MAKQATHVVNTSEEVEVLEFLLGGQSFGVNVLKVEAIEQYDPDKVTSIPMAPRSVAGTLLFRNRTIPLMDLAAELNIPTASAEEDSPTADNAQDRAASRIVLVTEFNGTTCAFIADGVTRIHRVTWGDINPIADVFEESGAEFTGSIHIEGREILIVDMERFVSRLNPRAGSDYTEQTDLGHPRQQLRPQVRIIIADDSGTVRTLISDVLHKGNYTNITCYNNGKAAYEAIAELKHSAESSGESLQDLKTAVITDIEMPQMDGLGLCRNIKQTLGLADLPVIVFSTQANDQTRARCERAKADACISKPQIVKLVEMLDHLTLEKLVEPASV